MKLNATSEMMPITWPEFANIHPFAPAEQTTGYLEMNETLNADLADITGFAAMSSQPNSGAQASCWSPRWTGTARAAAMTWS